LSSAGHIFDMIRRFKANRDAAKARLERKFGKRISLKQRTKLGKKKASEVLLNEIRIKSAVDKITQRARVLKIAAVSIVLTILAVYVISAVYCWFTHV
jgi:hypothetical protein